MGSLFHRYDFVEKAADNPTFYAEIDKPQSLNKYQYTYNNPLNMVDPDGHCPPCIGPNVTDAINLFKNPSQALDQIQAKISVVGMVPGYGEAADAVNAGISAVRGNFGEAALDLTAALGPAGSAAAFGNRIRKIAKAANQADNLVDAAKTGGHTANVRVLEEGRTVSKSREVSGNMTPEQKKMGYPKGN